MKNKKATPAGLEPVTYAVTGRRLFQPCDWQQIDILRQSRYRANFGVSSMNIRMNC